MFFLHKCIIYGAAHEIFMSDFDLQPVCVGDGLGLPGSTSMLGLQQVFSGSQVKTPREMQPIRELD